MELAQRWFFRDQLRSARAVALADAEGFQAVLHALEIIGQQLVGNVRGLGGYESAFSDLALASPLAVDLPSKWVGCHTKFHALYDELRQARNDAAHQGAYARTLTDHAVELTIILEDALMSPASMVSQFMVRNVVETKPWHPVSYVRQQMLTHAFSYLPIRYQNVWRFIPEFSIARHLRSAPSQNDRNQRLASAISDAVAEGKLELLDAYTVSAEAHIAEILQHVAERPLLVIDSSHEDVLVGLLSASDIL